MPRVPRTEGAGDGAVLASRPAPLAVIAALALALLGGGCDEPNALLITLTAERRVQSLDFLVRDQAAGVTIDEHLDVPLGDQDISKEGLKIAERFSKPGTYLIHAAGRDGAGLQVATKAYVVEGAVEVTLRLVALTATTDADGDGFPSAAGCATLAAPSLDCAFADCDDHDAGTNPFARERCNGQDDDCDGLLPPEEADADADGFLACTECDPNGVDWNPQYWDCRDCDDARADVHPASRRDKVGHPAAAEDCTNCDDHIDHNCNGTADEGCHDHDCDGYPDCNAAGAPPPPLCDCNDNDVAVNPSATEGCGDTLDNNCDGQTDEGCLPCDLDGDDFLRDDPANGCLPAPGQADCDDYDSGVKPGAADACGGKEGGCREMALRAYCRYTNPADPPVIHDCQNRPPAGAGGSGCPPRECDHDGDGYLRYDPANGCNPASALADCNDEDPHVFPGAPDYCGNGIAENCNSDLPCDHDADGDHYNGPEDDCDDANPLRHPWAVELCDGTDNDCDGLIDEGNPNSSSGAAVTGVVCTDSNLGECGQRPGVCVCSKTKPKGTRDPADRVACPDENLDAAASPRCFGAAQPRPETFATCNGRDDNCNGQGDDVAGEVPCAVGDLCRGAGASWKCTCSTDTGCDGCCSAGAGAAPDQCVPVGELSVAQCGIAGAACASCEDGNPCTTDSCDGACHHLNVADHSSCPGGQCRIPAAAAGICCAGCWTGTACVATPAPGCGTAGGDCAPASTTCGLCKVCDGAGQCGNAPVGQDPNGQCPDEGAGTCGRNGTCDGNGACQVYANGTACATCKTCDGAGHCGHVAGGQDPNHQCADEGGCGHDGACDGSGACRFYATSVRCGTCRSCNGAGACSGTPADDTACGTIACGGLTTTCRSYADVTTNRCLSFGACKPPNVAATCTAFTNTGANARCGSCRVCDGNGGCGNVGPGNDPNNDCTAAAQSTCGANGSCDGSGNCALFATGTGCATCARCDGGGHCNQTPADDAACGTIACSTLSTTCRTYSNLTANRCKALSTCKGVNPTDCTSFTDALPATSCGVCSRCSGGGCTTMPADDTTCGTIDCSPLTTACRVYSDLTANRCKTLGACKQYPADCSVYTNQPGAACATCTTCDASGGCSNLVGAGGDSSGACVDQGAASCGTNGLCNGTGGCQRYASGTACGVCRECDGAGTCAPVANGTSCGTGGRACCNGSCCASSQSCLDGGVCG